MLYAGTDRHILIIYIVNYYFERMAFNTSYDKLFTLLFILKTRIPAFMLKKKNNRKTCNNGLC